LGPSGKPTQAAARLACWALPKLPSLSQSPARTRFRIQDRGQCILLAIWQAFGRVEGQGTGNCVVTEIDHGKAGADPPRP